MDDVPVRSGRRADAVANRERLLEAAVRAFAADGPAASLKDIAKTAGVGIGTLYRHFPTRESLIEAAHENELSRLCASVEPLLASSPSPDAALRAWLAEWIEYLRAKDGLARALRATEQAAPAEGRSPHAGVSFPGARALALDAVGRLLAAGVDAGTVRPEAEPLDVLVAGNGIALAALSPEQADRLLSYLLTALRP